jgi:hypothetical protein
LLHSRLANAWYLHRWLTFDLQNAAFAEWAMLGSNQRPLPCEGSVIVCWRFLEVAKSLQIERFCL